jgi:putative ABC transport system permease protein
VLTLALGIGATTAIFSVVNGVLLRPLPYEEPGRLVALREISREGHPMNVPEQNFLDWQAGSHSFASMAFYNSFEASVAGGREAVRTTASTVSPEFFAVLRVKPFLGRLLGPEEAGKDAAPAVVVSYGFWRKYLDGDPDLSHQHLRSAGASFPIAGVTPPGFQFPAQTEVWVPRSVEGPVNPSRSAHNWRVIARLKPEATVSSARVELGLIARRIHAEFKDVTAVDAMVLPLADTFTARIRPALLMLAGAVGLLLLIACANVVNLMLARATAREKEFAVRGALGASRVRMVRQCVTESLVLALPAALLGSVLAWWTVDALLALGQEQIPRAGDVRVDGVVLGFSLAISVLVSVLLGLAPGWRAGRLDLQAVMSEAGRGGSGGAGPMRLRRALVVSQVALTLILLVGTGLLARSFASVVAVDLGFRKENRLGVDLQLAPARDDREAQRLRDFSDRLEARLAALPGVLSLGGSNSPPMSFSAGNGRFQIEGRGDSGDYWPECRLASPGYFATVGIPLLRGRLFDASDTSASPQVAVISRDVAAKIFPGEDPIGRRINTANMDGDEAWMTIVGVVGDIKDSGPESATNGTIYGHYLQRA